MNERIINELIESFGKLFMAGIKVSIPLTVTSFSTGLVIAFSSPWYRSPGCPS